ncbi:MAG: hypothetical protein IJS14_04020, partial [Lentisphaeria bacterium]|nr:hypothetical protein [Lentisphaeria bacterium]
MNNKLMIGWSEADITPNTDKFISLAGQYYARLTKEIHSRLKTVAVAFSSGEEHFLLASMDNGGVAEAFQKAVREAVVKLEPAIKPENIFINAIHTHNAPAAKVPAKVKGANGGVAKPVVDPTVYSPQEYIDFVVPVMAQNLVNA